MLKKIILITSLSALLFGQTAKEFQQQQMQGFKSYKKTQEEGFKEYQKEQMKAFNDYKKEIGAVWEEPKMSTKKTWVAYTKDKKTRTNVDFSKETIVVETIATSPEDAKLKLKLALAKVVTVDTKTVQETDPLEKKLARIKKPDGVVDSKVKAEPILSTVVFNKAPTKKSVRDFVNKNITKEKVKVVKSNKIRHAKIYSISVQLPKNSMIKRSKIYYKEVKKYANKQKLPLPLVFAIMHSESSFNPRAKSNIPAFGLMQIVPKTAGIDSYNYLYKKKRLVTGSYLYDSTNNIKMGTAYLHILYYRYLKKIKNPDSRLYCAIAGYNTGTGNIACAFNSTTKRKGVTVCSSKKGDYNINKAAQLINSLTPDQVKEKLLADLRWDEPKHYLKKVSKRMSQYKKVYGL